MCKVSLSVSSRIPNIKLQSKITPPSERAQKVVGWCAAEEQLGPDTVEGGRRGAVAIAGLLQLATLGAAGRSTKALERAVEKHLRAFLDEALWNKARLLLHLYLKREEGVIPSPSRRLTIVHI